MIGTVIGIVIAGIAAAILLRRLRDFIRSKGASACGNCPYSDSCYGGKCRINKEKG